MFSNGDGVRVSAVLEHKAFIICGISNSLLSE
jgi:hypothetical protein